MKTYQQGYIQLILIGIVAAVALGAGYMMINTYNGALERAGLAEQRAKAAEEQGRVDKQSLADQKLELTQIKMQKEADEKLAAARRRADQAIADYKRKTDAKLAELAKTSPEVRTWMDTAVPPAVISLVRGKPTDPGTTPGSDQDGAGKDTGIKGNVNPGARVAPVPNKRGAVGVNPLIRKSP